MSLQSPLSRRRTSVICTRLLSRLMSRLLSRPHWSLSLLSAPTPNPLRRGSGSTASGPGGPILGHGARLATTRLMDEYLPVPVGIISIHCLARKVLPTTHDSLDLLASVDLKPTTWKDFLAKNMSAFL